MRRLGSAFVVLAVAGVVVGVPSAGAAVVSGSNLSQAPDGETPCVDPEVDISCTTVINALPDETTAAGGARAGIDGVIVAWRVKAGESTEAHTIRLSVVSGTTGAGKGPFETLPKAAGEYAYQARVPVAKGDLFGVDSIAVPPGVGAPIFSASPDAFLDQWIPPLAPGKSIPPTALEELELLMNATIEPDADGDGWGDESQDKCPGSRGENEGCPPDEGGGDGAGGAGGGTPGGVVEVEPETTIVKGPKGTLRTPRATFRFRSNAAGSRFQCKLDRKPWRSCKSPRTYKGLTAGRHTFKVRAIGPAGAKDLSPARRSFKVEL